MYLAVRCVGGKERQAIESFERHNAAQYGENIKLHLFERKVVRVSADGQSKQVAEKLYPNYIFAEITDIDYEKVLSE